MARGPTRDRIVGLFDRGAQEKLIEAILDRAVEERVRLTQRALVRSKNTPHGTARGLAKKARRRVREGLIDAMKKSLASQGPGDTGASRPSMRQTDKDGGRSFHFQVYSVSKADVYRATASGGTVKGSQGPGAAAAHHAYIEREAALEALYEPQGPAGGEVAVDRGTGAREGGARPAGERRTQEHSSGAGDNGKAREARERERDDFDRSEAGFGKARAAQAYIENPIKLRGGEVMLNSFGTIGDTFEERLAFWNLLEANERKADARIQNRIICELPHQSTPEARGEILRTFVKPWEEKGIPFHVAVHAPGPKNDSRNYHAHLVFSERPAKKMVDPATGHPQWDFAITETYRTASYNKRVRHPYRQPKLREFGERGFIMGERKRFAEAVNTVMARFDPKVKFNPRSYKDMGLDVTPMKSVSRIIRDRMRKGRGGVLDPALTRRMIDAELTILAQRRDAELGRMLELTVQVERAKRDYPNVGKVNRSLEPRDRIGPGPMLARRVFNAFMDRRLEVAADRVQARIVARAELAVCDRVIAATNPVKTTAALRMEDPMALATPGVVTAGLDADGVALLHAAAVAEREVVVAELARTEGRLARLATANGQAWRKAVGAISWPVATVIAAGDDEAEPGSGRATPAAGRAPSGTPAEGRRVPGVSRGVAAGGVEHAKTSNKPNGAGRRAPSIEELDAWGGPIRPVPLSPTRQGAPGEEPQPLTAGMPIVMSNATIVQTSEFAKRIEATMKAMWNPALSGQALVDDIAARHEIAFGVMREPRNETKPEAPAPGNGARAAAPRNAVWEAGDGVVYALDQMHPTAGSGEAMGPAVPRTQETASSVAPPADRPAVKAEPASMTQERAARLTDAAREPTRSPPPGAIMPSAPVPETRMVPPAVARQDRGTSTLARDASVTSATAAEHAGHRRSGPSTYGTAAATSTPTSELDRVHPGTTLSRFPGGEGDQGHAVRSTRPRIADVRAAGNAMPGVAASSPASGTVDPVAASDGMVRLTGSVDARRPAPQPSQSTSRVAGGTVEDARRFAISQVLARDGARRTRQRDATTSSLTGHEVAARLSSGTGTPAPDRVDAGPTSEPPSPLPPLPIGALEMDMEEAERDEDELARKKAAKRRKEQRRAAFRHNDRGGR